MREHENDRPSPTVIHTIGHSTRSQNELIELLRVHGIDILIDIRRIPYSRYNPQFNREEMERVLPTAGIHYEHFGELGGVRPPQELIDRARSCSERSRGFSEYMRTPGFRTSLQRVIAIAGEGNVALMCAESDPTHCHRFWVADALLEAGIEVRHIRNAGSAEAHPVNLFSFPPGA